MITPPVIFIFAFSACFLRLFQYMCQRGSLSSFRIMSCVNVSSARTHPLTWGIHHKRGFPATCTVSIQTNPCKLVLTIFISRSQLLFSDMIYTEPYQVWHTVIPHVLTAFDGWKPNDGNALRYAIKMCLITSFKLHLLFRLAACTRTSRGVRMCTRKIIAMI